MYTPRLPARTPDWVKTVLVFAALYLFLVGIGAPSSAFKLMGKGASGVLLNTEAGPLVSEGKRFKPRFSGSSEQRQHSASG